MLVKKIPMSERFENAALTTYIIDDSGDMAPTAPRRAVIVCPGGGYRFLSDREAEPIVARFLGAGFNVFLLRYSVIPDTLCYEPLKQAAHAVAHVRENAEEYNIQPDKIFIAGFSAGGHVAASAGVLWNCPLLKEEFCGKPEGINRPDGMILAYPVITAGRYAHRGSFINLTGDQAVGDATVAEWSLELHVDSTTPPAFIWHTLTDQNVPVQNSFLLADALTKNGVSYELHIFPKGPHGMALANDETANGKPEHKDPHVAKWIDMATDWVKIQ